MAQRVTIKASEAHRGFGKLLKRVYDSDEHFIIERSGFPVAVMMSYQEYEQTRRLLADKIHQALGRQVGAEYQRQGITEEELIEKMEEDREAIYQEKYGQKK